MRVLANLRGRFGALPDFLIIGTQKGGTTSLYDYIRKHPDVAPARRKEIHFLDLEFRNGLAWYRSFFPTRLRQAAHQRATSRRLITGEATPYYLFHPLAPTRAHAVVPDARLIVLLRDPIERAYSHHQHEVRRGREHLSFREAVDSEAARLDGERARILSDPDYRGYNFQHFSYVARGFYAAQLRAWRALFPETRFLILKSEELFANPQLCLDKVFSFLELEECRLGGFPIKNPGHYEDGIDADVRARLREIYRAANRELCEMTRIDFGWT